MTNNNNILDTDVAVIGIGLRVPGASNAEQFYENLLNKVDLITECPKDRIHDNFFKHHEIDNHGGFIDLKEWTHDDPMFFGNSISDCIVSDPQMKLLQRVSYETIENASLTDKIKGTNTSVFIGFHNLEYENISGLNNLGSYSANLSSVISYSFNLTGESSVIATACSGSSVSISKGYESIINGNSDMSLCGGSNSIITTSFREKYFGYDGTVSKSGRSHSFLECADGYLRGEGAGMVLLKKYSKAIQDGDKVYCVIKGVNSNNDGSTNKQNRMQPSSYGQSNNIKQLLNNQSINPDDIYYIETHTTGTPVGDPVECQGLSIIFKDSHKDSPLYLGCSKPNIGHLESASGVISLIKVCLMMKHRKFLPIFNFDKPNPNILFDEWNLKVVTEPMDFPNKRINIGINNFGITGTNSFMIVSEPNETNCSTNQESNNNDSQLNQEISYLIPFSANSSKSLSEYQNRLISNIDSIKMKVPFTDFVQYQICKNQFINRNVILAKNWDELKSLNIQLSYTSKTISTMNSQLNSKIIYVFTGQGPQYSTMANELYNNNQVFKQSIDYCDSILSKYFGYSIFEKLRSINSITNTKKQYELINDCVIAQSSMFLVQYGLIELFKSWGIEPNIVLGHSFGEITAAFISKIIPDLETACKVIYHRSTAQNKTIGTGKMLSVSISKEEFEQRYSSKPYYNQIEIGCYNSSNSIVLVSSLENLELISNELSNEDIFCKLLGTNCAFHSSKQSIIKDEINQSLKDLCDNSNSIGISYDPTKIEFYSTVTSEKWDISKNIFDSNYIYDNISKPVNFYQTINNILNNNNNNNLIIVEISPHPTLSHYLKQIAQTQNKSISIVNPLHSKKNDIEEINQSISTIFCNGGKVNFLNQPYLNPNNNRFKYVNDYLPNYSWDLTYYFKESESYHKNRTEGPPIDLLGLKQNEAFNCYHTTIDLKKPSFRFLKDHQVFNKVLFPGCGYLNSLVSLYLKDGKDITISYLNCPIPFTIDERSEYSLKLLITNLSKSDDKFTFSKKDNKSDNSKWLEVCNGKISTLPHKQIKRTFNVQEYINSTCNLSEISKDDIYPLIKEKAKIVYGPHFQKIDKIYVGIKECICASSTSFKEKESIFDINLFSASIFDSSLHGILVSNFEETVDSAVFERFQDLRIFTSQLPKSRESIETMYYHIKQIKIEGKSMFYYIRGVLDNNIVIFEGTAVITTTTKIKNSITIKDSFYKSSFIWQEKESPIKHPSQYPLNLFKAKFKNYGDQSFEYWLSSVYYNYISTANSEFTLSYVSTSNTTQIIEKYLNDNVSTPNIKVFTKMVNLIKNNMDAIKNKDYYSYDHIDYLLSHFINNPIVYSYVMKSVKLQVCEIFNIPFDEFKVKELRGEPSSNQLPKLDEIKDKFDFTKDKTFTELFYVDLTLSQNKDICNIIQNIISPQLHNKRIFKIIEFGGGTAALSYMVLKSINDILESLKNYKIQIHYTFSDISPAFMPDAKKLLEEFKHITVIFKTIDLEKPLKDQDINITSYDIAIGLYVIHAVKDIKFSLNQIYQILNPSGSLIFIEIPKQNILYDSIFNLYSQWNSYDDSFRTDSCCLNIDEWKNALLSVGFKDISISKDTDNPDPFTINAQKPNYLNSIKDNSSNYKIYNQCFVYCSESQNDEFTTKLIQHYSNISNSINIIHSTDQFFTINNNNANNDNNDNNNNNNIIVFAKGLESLNHSNFEYYSFELIKILQFILNNPNSYKVVVLSLCAQMESTNYMNAALVGVVKYFKIYPEIKCYSIDLDDCSLESPNLTLNQIENLSNGSNFIERYFTIRNNAIYIEKVYKESDHSLKSNSFEHESLSCQLNKNLEWKLKLKPKQLKDHQVEVDVKASGINFKDFLIYSNIISSSNIGLEFSGIITRLGPNVCNFKVGDRIIGCIVGGSIGSTIIVNDNQIFQYTANLSFEEAASLPAIYFTVLTALYEQPRVKDGMVLLIHSATGGVGLSSLNFLKHLNFKGIVFATVGSDEKKQYLIDTYGSLIQGIYSTRDAEFSYEIKEYLRLNTNHSGVDIIVNTLPGEYISENLSLLKPSGTVADLSITHVLKNDQFDFKSFGLHKNYRQIEITCLPVEHRSRLGMKLSKFINNGLIPPPIMQYSVNDIKSVFEKISTRNYIGKFVVNYSNKETMNKFIQDNKNKNIIVKEDYKIDNNSLGETILITGQRGLALNTLKYIIKYSTSVKDIIVLSKSKLSWELQYIIKYNQKINNKLRIHYRTVEIGNKNEIKNAIDNIYSKSTDILPVTSIFHNAFALSDVNTSNIKMDNITEGNKAKTHGAINLHELSLEYGWNIKNFILHSSIATMFGSEGQAAYYIANSVIEGLSRYRKSQGLSSKAIKWGPLDSSYVTRSNTVNYEYLQFLLSVPETLGLLDLLIKQEYYNHTEILKYDLSFISNISNKINPLFSNHYDHLFERKVNNIIGDKQTIKEMFINQLSNILQIESEKLNLDMTLIEYGADSLLLVNIKNIIDKEFRSITLEKLQNSKINQILDFITQPTL